MRLLQWKWILKTKKRMAFAVVALMGSAVVDINNKQLVQLSIFHVTTLVNRTLENSEIVDYLWKNQGLKFYSNYCCDLIFPVFLK